VFWAYESFFVLFLPRSQPLRTPRWWQIANEGRYVKGGPLPITGKDLPNELLDEIEIENISRNNPGKYPAGGYKKQLCAFLSSFFVVCTPQVKYLLSPEPQQSLRLILSGDW
jgi:hypothetical protein